MDFEPRVGETHAAHIKPFSEGGRYSFQNGLLLRIDIYSLFNRGYFNIRGDYTIEVSHQLKEDYGQGKIKYDLYGERLPIIPENTFERPSLDASNYHNENVYLG